jgi:hypothetical protein
MRSDQEFVDDFLDAFRDVEKRVDTLPYFNERVLDKFDEPIPDWWLEEKCILPEIAEQCNVRFSETVFRPAPKSGRFVDSEPYEGPGIIFPHYWKGRLVGWQTRWLDEERPDWVPKYTMTTDFPKESTVYGYDQTHFAVNDPYESLLYGRNVIVVESVPSSLFVRSCGYPSIATFGSNLNDAQMRVLRRFKFLMLAPDNDPAGEKWLSANTKYLKRYSRLWHLPTLTEKPGADIGDLASDPDPLEAIREYVDQAQEVGLFPTDN